MHRVPRSLQAYIEIPIDRDPRTLLAAIGKQGAAGQGADRWSHRSRPSPRRGT